MSDTTDSIAQDQIKSFFKRWERLEEEKTAISDDLKELFAEAKGQGFDGKALRTAFRKVVKINDAAEAELNTVVELYVGAILGTGMEDATRSRAARESFDPLAGKITESRPADAPVATEADGPSGDEARQQFELLPPDPAAQEAGDPTVAANSSSGRTEPSADGQSNPDAPTPLPMGQGQRAAEPVTREQSPAEAKTSDQEPLSNGSGEVQDECAIHLPTNSHTTEEQGLAGPACIRDAGAANTKPAPILDTILSLRPHCQDPDTCASAGGKSHCFQCRKAAWLNGVEAA